eukprot:GHVU01232681.1.p1 GENE.GHVU01232681.1~~GHVU01232681.1.p1  ORF type:complete len:433 (+),score=40.91 GHVU01232681.1:219-1517(+)
MFVSDTFDEMSDLSADDTVEEDELEELLLEQSLPSPTTARKRLLAHILLLAAVVVCCVRSNKERVSRPRLCWDPHLTYLRTEARGSFDRYYRMSLDSFLFLRTLIEPMLLKDDVMAYVSCGQEPVDSTIVLHCTIRWLAGANYDDARVIAGISKSTFYRALYAGLAAICTCPELAYGFPSGAEEVNDAAFAFAKLSSHRVVRGCVGAMDGMLLAIRAPCSWETGHVRSYFSGHYKTYGVSLLAVCDHMSRFTHISVAQPGGANDITALRHSAVRRDIGALPLGRFVVADNGYMCTEKVITPFCGTAANDPVKDALNYFISQVRIRIEMAFGFLTAKWGRLGSRVNIRLKNIGIFVMAASRLHNFTITRRGRRPRKSEIVPYVHHRQQYACGYLPTAPQRYARDYGTTTLREEMLKYVDENGLRRPQHNLQRS